MEQTTILEGHSEAEKAAYLGAIASIATADRSASDEEIAYLEALCESANLSEEQTKLVTGAAETPVSDDDLKRCLDTLKTSDLRFSLVSDIIAFAQSDSNYSEEEKRSVEKIAQYLGVNQEQFAVLNQFTKKAVAEAPNQIESLKTNQTTAHGFLEGLGFGDKLKNVGINSNSLIKGALGVIGPIVLAKILSGRRGGGGGGLLGGVLGGSTGGGGGLLGGLLGGNSGGGGMLGGLGGLMSGGGGLLGGLLGGNRGFGNAGGLLGRILGG
jgi:uncharacterized tellurite resistance protein B-like protein